MKKISNLKKYDPKQCTFSRPLSARVVAGILLALTWLSLFLQLLKQYLLRNQREQHLLLFASLWVLVNLLICKIYGTHFICEHAKFGMGVLVLDEVLGIVSFLALFLVLLVIAGSGSGHLPPFWEVVSSGAIILKVGGRSRW
jgi:hypothetical protein